MANRSAGRLPGMDHDPEGTLRVVRPGLQTGGVEACEVVRVRDRVGPSLDDDAAPLTTRLVEIVDLERDVVELRRGNQLCATGGAKSDVAAVDDVVDRKHLDHPAENEGEATDIEGAEQLSTLLRIQLPN